MTDAAPTPALDMAQMERIAHMIAAIPAKMQVSLQAMAKLTGRTDVAIIHLDIPIEVNPWLGAGQWLTLDRYDRVVMINGQRVNPGPDIFGGLAGDGLSYPGWLR